MLTHIKTAADISVPAATSIPYFERIQQIAEYPNPRFFPGPPRRHVYLYSAGISILSPISGMDCAVSEGS